jgi:hypothetical protein
VGLLQSILAVLLPVLLQWLQQNVLSHEKYKAMKKEDVRATARAWVTGMFAEGGSALLTKFPDLVFLSPLLPGLESVLASELDAALDSAGL